MVFIRPWDDLEKRGQGQHKNLKLQPLFLLHILIAEVKSFPKHYN